MTLSVTFKPTTFRWVASTYLCCRAAQEMWLLKYTGIHAYIQRSIEECMRSSERVREANPQSKNVCTIRSDLLCLHKEKHGRRFIKRKGDNTVRFCSQKSQLWQPFNWAVENFVDKKSPRIVANSLHSVWSLHSIKLRVTPFQQLYFWRSIIGF